MALEEANPEEALALLSAVVAADPGDPAAHCSAGLALTALRRFAEAAASFERAIALQPGFAEAFDLQGLALMGMGLAKFSLLSFERAIQLDPGRARTYRNLGEAFASIDDYEAAGRAFGRAMEIEPGLPYAAGLGLDADMHLCRWRGLDARLARMESGIALGERMIPPFVALTRLDCNALLKKAAEIWWCDFFSTSAPLPPQSRRNTHRRLRVGYYCADFHEHPLMSLLAELFELHDKGAVELHAFSLGPKRDDAVRSRVERAFEHFHDVSGMGDRQVARLSRELEIDIGIDLAGYTGMGRPGIFSLRAAPIQVNFECYAGTLGAPHIDYMIADRVVLPEEHRRFYSEKVVYLPNSYLANDRRRARASVAFKRESFGLPQQAFVFCCFNNTHKITPTVFDVWMRMLRRVDGSVLWLYCRIDACIANLRAEAASRGIDPRRLVFCSHLPLPEHLARLALADLFVDTLPYCGHTSTSDALWSGLPVLTCLGSTFAGRVSASALEAAGMPELVTSNLAEYEDLGVLLASDRRRLEALRLRLARNRDTAPFFDTRMFARDLERAFAAMQERSARGLPPADIEIR